MFNFWENRRRTFSKPLTKWRKLLLEIESTKQTKKHENGLNILTLYMCYMVICIFSLYTFHCRTHKNFYEHVEGTWYTDMSRCLLCGDVYGKIIFMCLYCLLWKVLPFTGEHNTVSRPSCVMIVCTIKNEFMYCMYNRIYSANFPAPSVLAWNLSQK